MKNQLRFDFMKEMDREEEIFVKKVRSLFRMVGWKLSKERTAAKPPVRELQYRFN